MRRSSKPPGFFLRAVESDATPRTFQLWVRGRIAVTHMQFWAWAWLWKGHTNVECVDFCEPLYLWRPGSTPVQFWQTGSSFCLLPLPTSLVQKPPQNWTLGADVSRCRQGSLVLCQAKHAVEAQFDHLFPCPVLVSFEILF